MNIKKIILDDDDEEINEEPISIISSEPETENVVQNNYPNENNSFIDLTEINESLEQCEVKSPPEITVYPQEITIYPQDNPQDRRIITRKTKRDEDYIPIYQNHKPFKEKIINKMKKIKKIKKIKKNDINIINRPNNLVNELLARWWYVLPPWPPENYDITDKLRKNKLRLVNMQDWKKEDVYD